MENEAELVDIEGTLESSTSDMFQDNFHDVVQSYLPEKLKQSDVNEIIYLYNEPHVHEISIGDIDKFSTFGKLKTARYSDA